MQIQQSKNLKREFLKKWIMGIQLCSSLKENMTLLERKKAIKMSADIAMASTRYGRRSWSHAVITRASDENSVTLTLVSRILGSDLTQYLSQESHATLFNKNHSTSLRKYQIRTSKKAMSRKVGNIRCYAPRKCGKIKSNKVKARCIAKRLVKKRTQILKGLVPGGEYMDEYSLIKETLDYIVSLRTQVDVMHHLANSPRLLI